MGVPKTRSAARGGPEGRSRPSDALVRYMAECRTLVLDEIRAIIPDDGRYGRVLYDLMMDYPLREAKGLRPALCIAACRAFGGKLDAVLRSSAVLELYHNAFLIHDDIEDESILRRGGPTLHREHGIPVAVNVGDAMLGLALQPLLDNVGAVGLGPALRILRAVSRMTRETAEGQALELDWVRHERWDVTDDDYVEMVVKKTGWYSFITPLLLGGIAAGLPEPRLRELEGFGRALSIAFQIQDDVLNLDGDTVEYGKEFAGDLWEGKRTLMLLHALRGAAPREAQRARAILGKRRPEEPLNAPSSSALALLRSLEASGDLTAAGRRALTDALQTERDAFKTEADVEFLLQLIRREGSLQYAREVAARWASDAAERLAGAHAWLPPSVHRAFLDDLVAYVHSRTR